MSEPRRGRGKGRRSLKRLDPRFRWFVDHYGPTCWELDSLNPAILRERIEDLIIERIDWTAWRRAQMTEAAEIESLTTILDRWPTISGRASKYLPGPEGGAR